MHLNSLNKTMTTRNAPPLLFFTIFSVFFLSLNLQPGDDFYFRNALQHTDWLTFGKNFYSTWGGRYLFAFSFPTLISEDYIFILKIIYVIATAIFTISTLRIVNIYASSQLELLQTTIFYLSFFCFFIRGFAGSVLWLTGAFNFFLPFSCYTYILYILLIQNTKSVSPLQKSISLFFIPIACSFEQTAVLLILTTTFFVFFFKTRNIFIYSLIFIALLFSYILFSAEGNTSRYASEVSTWYPSFTNIPTYEKIHNSIQIIFESLIIVNKLFFILLVITIFFALLEMGIIFKNNTANVLSIILLITLFLIYCGVISGLSAHPLYGVKVEIPTTATVLHTEKYQSLAILAALSACSILVYLIYIIINNKKTFISLLCMVLFGVFTLGMMAFSPTIYASEYRVHFIMNMFFWILFGVLISKVHTKKYLLIICASAFLAALSQGLDVIGKLATYFL